MADEARVVVVEGTQSLVDALPSRRTRIVFVAVTALFCFTLIVALCWFGDSTNSLHTSALAWAFAMSGTVVTGFVFGEVIDFWNAIRYGAPTP